MNEKQELVKIVGELMVEVLWNPNATGSHCETDKHDILIKRENNVVIGILKHK